MGIDRMDEIFEDMQPKFNLNIYDEPMLEVKEFLKLLNALEELLHKHTKVTIHAFMTYLVAIMSTIFYNNCYNELVKIRKIYEV